MISLICTTFRRAHCVERIITQYLHQDYTGEVELIIFNTDMEYPIHIIPRLKHNNIIIINNNISYKSGQEYTNRGDICSDAVTHASGKYFMLADDDDYYLPWHVRQAAECIIDVGKDAWKPHQSFFKTPDRIELAKNTMEASVIVNMDRIRELGFLPKSGYEGLGWYTALRDERQLDENNINHIPSYCFNWGDPSEMSGHKQSGDINNPNNFSNHKLASTDIANRPLGLYNIQPEYQQFYSYILQHITNFNLVYYEKYAKHHVEQL